MRILTLSAEYPPFMFGGPAIQTRELSIGLAKAGHEPWVITFHQTDGPRETQLEFEEGVNICRVHNYSFIPVDYIARYHQQNVRVMEGVLRVLRAATPVLFDVIVLQGYWLAAAALAVHDAMGIPVVFHVRNIYSDPVPGLDPPDPVEQAYFRELETWALVRSNQLIAVSDYIARMCIHMGADPSRIHVIPNGLHTEDYNGEWIPNNNQTILYVGRLAPEKGLETLLRAVAIIRDTGTSVHLLMAGAGEEPYVRRLHELVNSLNLRRNIAFLGFIRGRDLVTLYQKSTVTVVPSYMESLGRVALEAMASGAPVVVTDVGGLGPLIRDGETGWKVPPRNVKALAYALTEAMLDREKAARLAAAARQESQQYSWKHILPKILDVYKSAAKEGVTCTS